VSRLKSVCFWQGTSLLAEKCVDVSPDVGFGTTQQNYWTFNDYSSKNLLPYKKVNGVREMEPDK
jgi:hypothetical protein